MAHDRLLDDVLFKILVINNIDILVIPKNPITAQSNLHISLFPKLPLITLYSITPHRIGNKNIGRSKVRYFFVANIPLLLLLIHQILLLILLLQLLLKLSQ